MDTKECKSLLQMNDLYFSKFIFENNKTKGKGETKVDVSYKILGDIDEQTKNKVKVQIDLNISSEDESISLFLQTIGLFEIEDKNLDPTTKDFILKRNTIAIMFPFIRSQVALITTQPGLQPIMLKPIDVNALVEKTEKK